MRRFIFVALIFMGYPIFAQNASDVLRLSQSNNYGTARFVGMGGAFGALGADFASLSYNPAGLGVYRSADFTITPSLKTRNDNTNYLNSPFSDSRTRFMVDNIGLVATYKLINDEEEKGLVSINFGLGYNRISDFYSETTAYGANSSGSIMDYFSFLANTSEANSSSITIPSSDKYKPFISNIPWDVILAWNTFLIDFYVENSDDYFPSLTEGDGVNQDQSISSSGGIVEYAFSFAGNISNKFYFGTTVGMQNAYFNQSIYYSENAFSGNGTLPSGDKFKNMNYNQFLTVQGLGLNLKLGAIYRPFYSLRLGVAIHTPTFFSLNEDYHAFMESEFNNFTSSADTPKNKYDYTITTPYKFIGSIAYTFGKAALSVDYEYIDYSIMRFGKGGDGYKFIDENTDIKSTFTNTYNIKAGGEVWLGQLALRGGYAILGSPYKNGLTYSSSDMKILSGGFGVKFESLYFDWAYQRITFNDKYAPYSTAPTVERDVLQNRFLLTVGYRF